MSITWTIPTRTTKRDDRETQVRRWVQAEAERRRERDAILGTRREELRSLRVSL